VVLVGLGLLAAGFWAADLVPLAFGVPAGILLVIGLGIDFRDPRAGLVFIAALAVVIVAAFVVSAAVMGGT
jgi:hypothetical protein